MIGILALDVATVTGWARWAPGEVLEYGNFRVSKPGAPLGESMARYSLKITDMIETYRPDMVVFEAPYIGAKMSALTARKLYGFQCVTEMICWNKEVPVRQATAGAIRKHFVGKGRAPRKEIKALVMEQCRARGWEPENDDQGDALALLSYAAFCEGDTDTPLGRPGGTLI